MTTEDQLLEALRGQVFRLQCCHRLARVIVFLTRAQRTSFKVCGASAAPGRRYHVTTGDPAAMSAAVYLPGFVSRVPGLIGAGYTEYLWNYKPNSWVAKIASAFRVLALLVALPVIVLGILDIVSYGIARTLGIVDDVKASTSDKVGGLPFASEVPVIHINEESTSSDPVESDREVKEGFIEARHTGASNLLAVSQPKAFYASESDGLGLAGADIFSPAVSEPSSPTLARKTPLLEGSDIGYVDVKLREGLRLRQVERVKRKISNSP